MSFLGSSIFQAAPHAAAYPLSLPAAPAPQATDTRVAPARGGDGAGLDHDLRRYGAPQRARRDGHSAPPSILQMKIDSLLREQAERRADEAAAAAARNPSQRTDAAALRPDLVVGSDTETPAEDREGAGAARAGTPPAVTPTDALGAPRKGA